MKHTAAVLIFSFFFYWGISRLFAQINPARSPSTLVSNNLQAIWDDEITQFGAEGGIIGIHVPGLWTWKGSNGNARITPNQVADASFTFRIASLSKSVVASALLKLQEQTVLDLDDNIGLYLDASLFTTIPNGSSISIRQLLNHTSGIADYLTSPGYIIALATLGLSNNFTPEQLVGFGVAGSPLFAPGSGWAYSNTNYTLAALVIEGAISGSYENYIENNLLVPLGLSETYFPSTNALPGNYMGSYTDLDNDGDKDDFSVFSPSNTFGSGPLASKLGDMLKWLELLENGQVLSAASMAEMKSWVNSTITGVDYGLGLGEFTDNTYASIGHTGSIFNTSNMQHFPAEDFYLVFNVTDLDFPSYSAASRIYNYMKPLLDSCRKFSPQIETPAQTAINQGQNVNLQAEVGNNYSYQWYLDGQIVNGANASNLQASLPGEYRVLIADGIGCQFQTAEVSLADCQSYQVEISPNQPVLDVCQQTQINLAAGSATDSVNWYDQSGNILLASSNSFSFPATTNTFVLMEASDGSGCLATDTIQIDVNGFPSVELGPDLELCEGESIELSVVQTNDAVTWRDLSGRLLLSNSNNYSFTVTQDITIVAEQSNTCGLAKDTVFIVAIPLPSLDLGPDLIVCEQDSIRLEANFVGNNPNWYDENLQSLDVNTDVYFFISDQDRMIIAEVNSGCGIAYDTIAVTVTNQAQLDLGEDLYECTGSEVELHAGSSADKVNWYDFEGDTLLDQSRSYVFTLTEDDTIISNLESSCGMASDTISIFALPSPEIELGSDTAYASGDTVRFSLNLVAGTTINWYDLAGNLLANTSDFEFVFQSETSLIAIADLNSCTASDTVFLSLATGINPTWNPRLKIYPNPANEIIQIHAFWDESMKIKLSLNDMRGQGVMHKDMGPDNHIDLKLALGHLAKGLYLLILETEKGFVSRKIIIY